MICVLASHYCPLLHSGPACPPVSSYLLPPADPSRQLPDLALGENPSHVLRMPLPFLGRAFSSLGLANTLVPSCPGSSLRVVFIPCDSLVSNGPSSVQTSLCSPFSAPCWAASQEEAAQAPLGHLTACSGVSTPTCDQCLFSGMPPSAGSNAPEAARLRVLLLTPQPRHPVQNTVPSVLLSWALSSSSSILLLRLLSLPFTQMWDFLRLLAQPSLCIVLLSGSIFTQITAPCQATAPVPTRTWSSSPGLFEYLFLGIPTWMLLSYLKPTRTTQNSSSSFLVLHQGMIREPLSLLL